MRWGGGGSWQPSRSKAETSLGEVCCERGEQPARGVEGRHRFADHQENVELFRSVSVTSSQRRKKPEQSFGSVRRSDHEAAPEDKNVKTNSSLLSVFCPRERKKKTRPITASTDTRPVCRTRKIKPNTSWESFVMRERLPKNVFLLFKWI